MMAESALIPDTDLKRYIELLATHAQNGAETRTLENQLKIPPWAIADHVNYDGCAVFFPGTYASGCNQGSGAFGFFPPFCDNYYFILMLGYYVRQSGDLAILSAQYAGVSLLNRLVHAFEGYNIDPDSGLCVSDPAFYTVDWGFVDTVKKSGKLLMASLLRYSAAQMLAELFGKLDLPDKDRYLTEAQKIRAQILATFFDTATGWFYSATGIGHQYDVWATAYAVYSGVTNNEKTLQALYAAYKNHTAVANGYVRHILSDQNFSAASAWECSSAQLGEYQNGAYWATPTGWYAFALYKYNGSTDILSDFLRHTEKHLDRGAPFEWIDASTEQVSGLRYGTSGVLPYIAAQRIINAQPT